MAFKIIENRKVGIVPHTTEPMAYIVRDAKGKFRMSINEAAVALTPPGASAVFLLWDDVRHLIGLWLFKERRPGMYAFTHFSNSIEDKTYMRSITCGTFFDETGLKERAVRFMDERGTSFVALPFRRPNPDEDGAKDEAFFVAEAAALFA